MRVLLADPPAFTPQYDHELASALVRAGAEVELVTSPFRFGDPPEPDGYRRSELFYPVSSKLFRRSRLRIPVKLLEHPVGLARLRRRSADVAHIQWLAAPELDDRLLRQRAPLVFTAHDLLPRRTAAKRPLATALRTFRPRSSSTASTAASRWPSSPIAARAPRHLAPGLPRATRSAAMTGTRSSVLGSIRPTRGWRRNRGGTSASRERGSWSRATHSSRWTATAPPPATRPSGASATSPTTRSTARSVRRRSRSSPTGPRSTRAAPSCGRWAPACRPWSTTSAASASRFAASEQAASSPPAMSRRSRRPRASSWAIRTSWSRLGRAPRRREAS